MFREIRRILQLTNLLIVQSTVGGRSALVRRGQHQHFLLVLRSKRVALVARLRDNLPLAPRLIHDRYHVLVGRGSVVVLKLPAELLDLPDLVMGLINAQVD